MKKTLILFFLLIIISRAFAQESTIDKVKSEYNSFQYENMIRSSDELLTKGNLSDSLKVEIYVMRAVAFYSLGNDASTRSSFESILHIRRNFIPDPAQISPKLISIFNEVKTDFIKNNPEPVSLVDSTTHSQPVKLFSGDDTKNLILENLGLPGIAQYQLGRNPKGIILTAASAINLGALIYYLIDTKNKENDYLNQTDKALISQKYDLYNKSYKIRNTLIISYALIWIYSQVDLLFLSEDEPNNSQQQTGLIQIQRDLYSDYSINVKIPF